MSLWSPTTDRRVCVAKVGFRSTATLLVDNVVGTFSFPDGGRRVIDIGGGYGLYVDKLSRIDLGLRIHFEEWWSEGGGRGELGRLYITDEEM